MKKKLFKSRNDRKVAGVCGGIAEYFDIDSTLVRLAVVLLIAMSIGTGLLAYIVAAIVMPDESVNYNNNNNNYYDNNNNM